MIENSIIEPIVCVMAAKSKSSRLPGKNKLSICGKPLFQWPLEAAAQSGVFAEVWLSTDDDDIARLGNEMDGVWVDIRPRHVRGDAYSVPQVAAELIDRLGGEERFPVACAITACCPLTTSAHLREAAVTFMRCNAEAMTSVYCSESDPRYPYRINGGLLHRNWSAKRIQSNTAQPVYFSNGAFVFIKTEVLIREKTWFIDHCEPYIMSRAFSYDIDTPEDFQEAEAQLKRLLATGEYPG